MEIITAKQARKNWEKNMSKHSPLLVGIMAEIRNKSHEVREINYFTGGEHLSDGEEEFLRQLGFTLSWNSPCLWYEISW